MTDEGRNPQLTTANVRVPRTIVALRAKVFANLHILTHLICAFNGFCVQSIPIYEPSAARCRLCAESTAAGTEENCENDGIVVELFVEASVGPMCILFSIPICTVARRNAAKTLCICPIDVLFQCLPSCLP